MLTWRREVWFACASGPRPAVWRWLEGSKRWQRMEQAPDRVRKLAARDDDVWLAAPQMLARHRGGSGADWQLMAAHHPEPTALAIGPERVYVGSEQGLWIYQHDGRMIASALLGIPVTGIVALDGRSAWVATREGLHYHDGLRWHAWRFAQGLPEDLVRDVALDGQGRLWLGGTPVAMMSAAAAARAIVALAPARALPANVFADACAAAAQLLGPASESGQIARAVVGGHERVFIDGRQVCPNPWESPQEAGLFWRRADGALLHLDWNGNRGWSSCGPPCQGEEATRFARFWRLRVHGAAAGQRAPPPRELPLPQPLPTQSPLGLIALTGSGDVWVATHSAGLFQFDGQRWRRHGEEAGLGEANPIQALADAAEGSLWVGASPQWRDGRVVAGPALQRWEGGRWQAWEGNNGVHSLAAAAGALWVGYNGRLQRIAPEGMERIEEDELRQRGLIATLGVDRDGRPWFAHSVFREGIGYHDGKQLGQLNSRQGLFDDSIRVIGHDDQRRVWLLAEDGRVAVYEREVLLRAMRH